MPCQNTCCEMEKLCAHAHKTYISWHNLMELIYRPSFICYRKCGKWAEEWVCAMCIWMRPSSSQTIHVLCLYWGVHCLEFCHINVVQKSVLDFYQLECNIINSKLLCSNNSELCSPQHTLYTVQHLERYSIVQRNNECHILVWCI